MPSALEIARMLDSTVEGVEDAVVERVALPGDSDRSALVFLSDRKMDSDFQAGIIVSSFEPRKARYDALIRVSNVRLAMARILPLFDWHRRPSGRISRRASIGRDVEIGEGTEIMDFAYVGNNVRIGRNVLIYPHVYIGDNVEIGDYTVIYPGVYVGERVSIGRRVIIHSGARIGADGFGYERTDEGWQKIPQIGSVVIEDDVEIGANSTIDRATIGETRIGRGTKIDNLVQIAHNVVVGENSMIVAQTGIAGSTRIGKWVILAGQVGVADHVEVPDGVIATAKTGLSGKLKPNTVYSSGLPQMERTTYLRVIAILRRLPEIYEKVRKLLDGGEKNG